MEDSGVLHQAVCAFVSLPVRIVFTEYRRRVYAKKNEATEKRASSQACRKKFRVCQPSC